MNDRIRPISIESAKRRAKTLSKVKGIPLHQAQNLIAKDFGYNNYSHLRHQRITDPIVEFPLRLIAHWRNRETNRSGQESLVIQLSKPWQLLIRQNQLKDHRALSSVRPSNLHWRLNSFYSTQEEARSGLNACARTMRFISLTGLRPSSGYSKAFPNGVGGKFIPGSDHMSIWYYPATKDYLITDEPYKSAVERHIPKRLDWSTTHQYRIEQSEWAGMYAPQIGSILFLITSKSSGIPIDKMLNELKKIADDDDYSQWAGDSVDEKHVWPEENELEIKKPQRNAKQVKKAEPAVDYHMALVGPAKRPDARMPVIQHERLGRLLKWCLSQSENRKGLHNLLSSVRFELDEWVQQEYPSETELPQETFLNLYYHEELITQAPKVLNGFEWTELDSSINLIRVELIEGYPDCKPVRGLLTKLDKARVAARKWAGIGG